MKALDVDKIDHIFNRARRCFQESKPDFMKEASTLAYELLLKLMQFCRVGGSCWKRRLPDALALKEELRCVCALFDF